MSGKRQKFYVNGTLYSKTELKRIAQVILNRHEIGSIIEGDDEDFLIDLFGYHPELPESDIVVIGIVKTKHSRTSRGFMLYFSDEEPRTASYITCVDNMGSTIPISRYRRMVKEQISEFRRRELKSSCTVCPLCNTAWPQSWHVDHIVPFKEIVMNFLSLNVSYPHDEPFYIYHDKNAQLRMVCQDCNLTRRSNVDTRKVQFNRPPGTAKTPFKCEGCGWFSNKPFPGNNTICCTCWKSKYT